MRGAGTPGPGRWLSQGDVLVGESVVQAGTQMGVRFEEIAVELKVSVVRS